MRDTQLRRPDIILFCAAAHGGIADYAHQQAEAIAAKGPKVLMLCPTDYPHPAKQYQQKQCLPASGHRSKFKAVRVCRLVRNILAGYSILTREVLSSGCFRVLLASYSEYLAPLWAWKLRRLKQRKVQFAAVAHDPVRDFVVGPVWWHRRSISEGYSFLDSAFIHEVIELDTGTPAQNVKTVIIPHGAYPFPNPTESRETVRSRQQIPDNAKLFLSYGHLRDGKNLKLILEAMIDVPTAWLLVAGTEAGTGHAKSTDLIRLAQELGVHERCRWNIGFVSPEETANLFEASDYVLLTYSRQFRSASGVLNVATRFHKPVVASCGPGNLESMVKKYHLGVYVEPDRADEIARGMREILATPTSAEWDRYNHENSWERNAELVLRTFGMQDLEQ
jgi:glycosyltransferase involved in cell wall biosynthesis